jgi:hypothetical protein
MTVAYEKEIELDATHGYDKFTITGCGRPDHDVVLHITHGPLQFEGSFEPQEALYIGLALVEAAFAAGYSHESGKKSP